MFDRFFDMLNTRCLEEGIQKRKPDLAPYRTQKDSRLKVSYFTCSSSLWNFKIIIQWLETEFLGYLNEWDSSVKRRTGFTPAEQKRMRLSDETLEGLRVTGIDPNIVNYMLKVLK